MTLRPRLSLALAAGLLTLVVVWALVLGWWQANDVQPGSRDLALYLVLLPLALVGGYALLRGFIGHLQSPPLPRRPRLAPRMPANLPGKID